MPALVRQPRIRLAVKLWLAATVLLAAALMPAFLLARSTALDAVEAGFRDRLDAAFRRVRDALGTRGWEETDLLAPELGPILAPAVRGDASVWLLGSEARGILLSLPPGDAPDWPDSLPTRARTVGAARGEALAGGVRYIARAARITGGGNRTSGVIVVALPVTGLSGARARAQRVLALGFAAIAAAGAGLLWLVSRRMTRPLPDLMEASWRLGLGDFQHRAPVTTRDELGVLALTLNDAAATMRRSREQLRRAGRIQAWHEVARQVAHEIKNPLAGMRAAAENLHRAAGRDEVTLRRAAAEASEVVGEEVASLSRLADAFSSLARLPEPRPGPLDLNHTALHVVQLAAGEDRPGIEITTDLDPDLPPVRADETQIGQVLKNLVKNAAEAIPETGGRIVVATTRRGDEAELRVEDSGPGIPAEERERIFEPFVSTKAGGSGIGLALARQIAEAHGGNLLAEEAGEGGAALVLRLPLDEDEHGPFAGERGDGA